MIRAARVPDVAADTAALSLRSVPRLLLGLALVFALFEIAGAFTGSDRGQAGLVIGALVVLACLAVERVLFGESWARGARLLGLGRPAARGSLAALGIGGLLLTVPLVFARATGASIALAPDAFLLLPGLFAQAGVAEETLFRGYLFRRLRLGRSFWRAATLAMVPFVAVHGLLFVTLPWQIAALSLIVAAVLSFPFAYLFELGGGTIWPPALLHFVIQATVKVLVVSGDAAASFPIVWMAASVAAALIVLLIPRRPCSG